MRQKVEGVHLHQVVAALAAAAAKAAKLRGGDLATQMVELGVRRVIVFAGAPDETTVGSDRTGLEDRDQWDDRK